MTPETKDTKADKQLLIAVDDSDSSRRAVVYVANLLGGFPGFSVSLLSIIPDTEEDFFENEAERKKWIKEKFTAADVMLERYRQILIQSGFPEDNVRYRSCLGETKSLSDAILETHCDITCCTVVVGRHPKTKTEEFLFGSTSNRLIHEARDCAVWVVA